MSEKDISRWHNTITPFDKAPHPWTLGSGGSWDMLEVQPIPDAMLAELAQRYHYAGTPWNCRSMPLSDSDREYMYLLYSSMQGLVARMRAAEREAAKLARNAIALADVISTQCIAMQAAVIDAKMRSPAEGMEWIENTLRGPGLLPDMAEARAMPTAVMQTVAQAWFDAKMAEHEKFRAEHPAP